MNLIHNTHLRGLNTIVMMDNSEILNLFFAQNPKYKYTIPVKTHTCTQSCNMVELKHVSMLCFVCTTSLAIHYCGAECKHSMFTDQAMVCYLTGLVTSDLYSYKPTFYKTPKGRIACTGRTAVPHKTYYQRHMERTRKLVHTALLQISTEFNIDNVFITTLLQPITKYYIKIYKEVTKKYEVIHGFVIACILYIQKNYTVDDTTMFKIDVSIPTCLTRKALQTKAPKGVKSTHVTEASKSILCFTSTSSLIPREDGVFMSQ